MRRNTISENYKLSKKKTIEMFKLKYLKKCNYFVNSHIFQFITLSSVFHDEYIGVFFFMTTNVENQRLRHRRTPNRF